MIWLEVWRAVLTAARQVFNAQYANVRRRDLAMRKWMLHKLAPQKLALHKLAPLRQWALREPASRKPIQLKLT
ncbi:hypothetical protein EN871_18685 [bacterium M00.F.Ca.ET.228.01.1.1]|uniref:hypothetical protein n=1 Tax=Paraburkholderia phenoliruptrix TaxID=252970 RepID=UPI0010927735|nr:hypothetical protein [Paraburkholderia phenoliruptrix]TGP42944.1 hypothetical protein EN871_18685 [bacterium M00.F.Ca.ET.228.01.1.1]TGR99136.1 hypothetical protein EN834_21325 [bacterium M00.F.Ca.ET.191.01.1.1]TGU03447.1 hypothetical protein EN798_22145 [bacterium M00.F.Ca.ET.155.01.1.1]MBW0449519.1 hypothetical protein [Paraburkholderia phenoliruptrix]MBW9099173.1 hypothetical protein [Paraburkholderia phenoliruptrix]